VAEAELAMAHGAQAVGLVANMPSGPGPISDAGIAHIARATANRVQRFLLTSRTDPHAIADHVHAAGTDTVQLVDTPTVGALQTLRALLPSVAIVPVIHVRDASALDQACALAPYADMLLLDSGNPSAAVRELGGTGRPHDWTLSAEVVRVVAPVPVLLAGGLRADNVASAIRIVRPAGVDLCSGVRTDGQLDANKLAAFVAAWRAAAD
jgi:phosphoribosylanthranilate isomerase